MYYDDNNKTDKIETNSIQSTLADGKMLFVYQSVEMKEMFHRYGNELMLLDATYKTTEYTLPLFS